MNMRFLAPHFLHLAWLALIPLALYLFKKKARRLPVSTLLFFRSLAREHQESAWLRRLKRWLSLLLTLLVLLLAVFALARPAADAGARWRRQHIDQPHRRANRGILEHAAEVVEGEDAGKAPGIDEQRQADDGQDCDRGALPLRATGGGIRSKGSDHAG